MSEIDLSAITRHVQSQLEELEMNPPKRNFTPGPNCISRWLPLLEKAGANIPETHIVRTEVDLIHLCDGVKPEGTDEFVASIREACDSAGYPCFLRTGQTSNKHSWKRSCFIADKDANLLSHIYDLVEFSAIVDHPGNPMTSFLWAVRRFVPLFHVFTAFEGMPVAYERRYFIDGNKVVCSHPYWPLDSFKGLCHRGQVSALTSARPADHQWWTEKPLESPEMIKAYEDWLYRADANFQAEFDREASRLAASIPGSWSLDLALSEADETIYAIDMAQACHSFHWPACERVS